MKKFVPYEKMSKKAKRAEDAGRRVTWKSDPVTRVFKNKKKYDRKSIRRRRDVSDFDFRAYFTSIM